MISYRVTSVDSSRSFLADAVRRVYGAVLATTLDIETMAKEGAPVKTGHLRRLIRHEVEIDRYVITGIVIGDADYTIFQEMGTRYMPGKFFMTRAIEANYRAGEQRIAQALKG